MNAVRASFFLPSLDEITNTDPLIVNHEATVDSIVEQMNQHGATCALVHTAGQITGIFTIYDAVRIAANTATLNSKTAREATAHPIITIPRHHPEGALAALRLLTQHQIRHLLVLGDDGTVAGVISHESICAILTPAMLMRLRTVVETMRIDVISVLADQSLLSIARTMDERQASCVVVIEIGTNGKVLPLGLITDRDIARAHAAQVDLDTTHARAQIAPQLISVSPDTNLWDAYQLMDRAHVRRLVVIAPDGRLLGLITQETLLSAATPHEI
ncbi:MAG: CBS domain-containing protein, partial [Oscillochloris sp.]|nr:CBS domain-containing protein [Oscillochloris sp.]